jgi:hypothetical protein
MRKYIWATGPKIQFTSLSENERKLLSLSERKELEKLEGAYFNVSKYEAGAKTILSIVTAITIILFGVGWLEGKISLYAVLGWSLCGFIFFLLLLGIDYLFSDKPHPNAGLLLTDNALIYFWNEKILYYLPLEGLDFKVSSDKFLVFTAKGNEVKIDPSGFSMKDISPFLYHCCARLPKFKETFEKFGLTSIH